MDTFRSIKYEKFNESTNKINKDKDNVNDTQNNFISGSNELYTQKPIYRKLNIIPEEASDSSELYLKNDTVNQQNPIKETNLDNDQLFSINLNSTMKYYKFQQKPIENKYFDSETMTSFNDINELNNPKTIDELNDIRYAGNIENLRLEVDDNKNILKSNLQKIYERDGKLTNIEEKSNLLFEESDKSNKKSRKLFYVMFMKYMYHIIGIILMIIIIIVMIVSLVKN